MRRLKPTNINWRQLRSIALLTACLLLLIIFAYGPTDNWSWDPSFYYAHIRSSIIDGDLNFYNDTQTGSIEVQPTQTNHQPSLHPIGPGLLWSPFFLVAHLITTISNPSQADGLSLPYIAAVSVASMVFAGIGLLIVYKLTKRYSDRFAAIIACLLCLAATPLFFYIFRQPISAHSTTLLITASMVWVFVSLEEEKIPFRWSGLLFGSLLGLIFINRWSGLIMAVYPLVFYIKVILSSYRGKKMANLTQILIQTAISLGAFLIAISPQIIAWLHIYGKFLVIPQHEGMLISELKEINLLALFFASNRGLLTWAPFIFLGMLGLFWIKDRSLKIAAILHALLLIIILATRTDWYGGGLFGTRYFLEVLPVIAIGFVSLWSAIPISDRIKPAILVLFSAVAVTHQFVLMHAVEFGIEQGWINLKNYLVGKPVGLRFQWLSFQRLASDPESWLVPRPYVDQERQTIAVNILASACNLKNCTIQAVALAIAPILVVSMALIDKYFKLSYLPYLMGVLLAALLTWSAYLLTLL